MSDLGPRTTKKKSHKPKIYAGIIIAIILGSILLYTNTGNFETQPIDIIFEDQNEGLLEFIVTDQGPYALNFRDHDFVLEHMNHENPTIKQFQNTTYWAKSLDKETLLDMEYEILEGARANNNKISVAEKVMLEIITWSAYPELCIENPKLPNCSFMDINYNQARYEKGEITRDEFWLNIKQYANATTIAQVEGMTES